jgi:hypothetical protein
METSLGEEDQIRNHYNELAYSNPERKQQTNRDTFPMTALFSL